MQISKNGITVEVPIGLPTSGSVKDDGYQVFLQEETDKLIRQHVEALTCLPKYIWGEWSRILHPFAGLGVTAQVLDKGTGRTLDHVMWERDKECVKYLKNQGYDVTHVVDSYKKILQEPLEAYDAIMFDPTAGTIKTPGMIEFWDRVGKARVPLVWATDSACSKIWLHRDHYRPELGRHVRDTEDYLRAYNDFLRQRGYTIVEALRETSAVYFVAIWDVKVQPFEFITRL
jgi:hypothetical protein